MAVASLLAFLVGLGRAVGVVPVRSCVRSTFGLKHYNTIFWLAHYTW